MALFVFSAQSLANQLQESVNKGLKVRLLADPSFAKGTKGALQATLDQIIGNLYKPYDIPPDAC